MTQEEKELLLKDLSARLLYGVKVQYTSKLGEVIVKELRGSDIEVLFDGYYPERYKPFLRPMSSMTEEERKEYKHLVAFGGSPNGASNFVDWLNAHHFDYRGLIKKGLALEAPEGMYKTE